MLMGKQAIDGDNNAVGQMLAALLDWPQATFASKVEIDGGKVEGDARGRRRPADARARPAGGGHRRPAPERAALRLAAQHHEGQEEAARRQAASPTIGVDLAGHLKVLKVTEPPKRVAGVKVETAAELVAKLKTEAGVI